MRLQFDKSGRRFFFLTFCVRGREAILSRIVKKAERDGKPGYAVELTPAGGAMAALYAAREEGLAGLVLLAAYATKPLALPVLEIHGSEDGVLNRQKLMEGEQYLPDGALSLELPGGNHAQFGDYGPQKGDGLAAILPEEQWDLTARAILDFAL